MTSILGFLLFLLGGASPAPERGLASAGGVALAALAAERPATDERNKAETPLADPSPRAKATKAARKTAAQAAPEAAPKSPSKAAKKAAHDDGSPDRGGQRQAVYDLLRCRQSGGEERAFRVQLCPRVLELPLPPNRQIEFPLFFGRQQKTVTYRALGRDVIGIEYYEERIAYAAAAELGLSYADLVQPGQAVPIADDRAMQIAARADTRLRETIAEHDSAVERGLRVGPEWNGKVRRPLVRARENLGLGRIDWLLRQEKWPQAEVECDRLGGELAPGDPVVAALAARQDKILQARAQAALTGGDFAAARQLLERFAARHSGPPAPAAHQLQEMLAGRAKELLHEAESLKTSSPQKAVELVSQAAAVWPSVSELEAVRRRIVEDYPILRCAYPALPADLCPLTAREPVDRHASALVCEGLVRWVDDPAAGGHFVGQLAEGRPFPLVRGRGFYLARAKWSDSTDTDPRLCTVEDVRFTVKLLQDSRLPGYSPVYGGLLQGVENAEGGDPFVALVRLARDHWQPLSLMDFPILPRHYFSGAGTPQEIAARLSEFSRRPVGTGPFRPVRDPQDGFEVRRFAANPQYRVPGLPRIREITFEQYDPARAVNLFLQKRIHLIYDVRPEQVNQLQQQGRRVVALRTPAVWFLAPNYERKPLGNANLRLAIASAIDREAILKQYFRPVGREGDHAALSGPYPRNSWAYDPQVEMFQQPKAKPLAALAARELGGQVKLRLVYPGGSPEIESACKQIEAQVLEAGIALELRAIEPGTYRARVIESRDFDLAYWSYCYPDATYWIEPLLGSDPAAGDRGAWNVMRYRPDEELAGLLRDVRLHKSFRELEKLTHRIHEHVARSAAIIPLWQLDTYVAVSDGVKDATLDPLVLFGNVEKWRLEGR